MEVLRSHSRPTTSTLIYMAARNPIANRIHTAISFYNAYTLENPSGARGLQNRSFVQAFPSGISLSATRVLIRGFIHRLVAPTTCSFTICLTTCKGVR